MPITQHAIAQLPYNTTRKAAMFRIFSSEYLQKLPKVTIFHHVQFRCSIEQLNAVEH